MKKVLVVFGTRPEAIKMCPVVNELKRRDNIDVKVCLTGQHKEMLKQVIDIFDLQVDYNLNIMKENQSLAEITCNILSSIMKVLKAEAPDIVLVHGDTTTTLASALAAYYAKVSVGHVEAGLRTYDINSPFPEELNRQVVSLISKYHFAPTQLAKENLLKEGKKEDSIYVTGNTAIDTLAYTINENYHSIYTDWIGNDRLILLTVHRRENLGQPMCNIFRAIRRLVNTHTDIKVLYPIHKNPKIRVLANEVLKDEKRIKIIEPLNVVDFHNIIAKSTLVLTDSGGIQEEAPSLGKPVFVLRDTTERPEGVLEGTLKLIGTAEKNIFNEVENILNNAKIYEAMATKKNPYGDGKASIRIANILSE